MRVFWDDRTLDQDINSCVGCEDYVDGKCISKGRCGVDPCAGCVDYIDGECIGGKEYERKCMLEGIARMISEVKKVLAEKSSKQKEG